MSGAVGFGGLGARPKTIVVVGGGIAGLAVSFELLDRASGVPGGLEVICLESSERPGGNIRTDREDGFTCEWGPNGFLDNVATTPELVRRLGIQERLLPSDRSAERRFILRGGKLRQLPKGALSFLGSDALSVPGRLRVLTEPFREGKRDDVEESVFGFATRRIGAEAAEVLVGAMVTGIYAGDARQLSLQATFPKMAAMERDHGTLTKAMLAKRKGGGPGGGPAGPGGRLTSFRSGLQELPDALARRLGAALRLRARAVSVADMGVRGFRVLLGEGAPIDADAVVLACPSWHASDCLSAMDNELSKALGGIPSASLAVVHLGFRTSNLGARLDGFGYLIPRSEGVRTLGTLWSSSIFPGRAPEGHALLTSMIGGALDDRAAHEDDATLLAAVRADLRTAMGIDAEPIFVRVFRHPRGIPQYVVGHMERLRWIDQRLAAHRGLLVCGNSYRGISVNACVQEAAMIAEAALAHPGRAGASS